MRAPDDDKGPVLDEDELRAAVLKGLAEHVIAGGAKKADALALSQIVEEAELRYKGAHFP